MSQENKDKADVVEARTQQTRGFMQRVRVASRRKYTPEEKVRIVLEGFRREVAVNELCRREGIKPGAFYAWTKGFMEAGKERLTRDAVRDATRQEIEQIKRESTDLKHLVAGLSLEVYRLKKTAIPLPEDHNGTGYVSRSFRDYLRLVGIGHILAATFHPQTSGKVERAIADFVDNYNYRRYHNAPGNVTPADVLYGRREEILERRKEVQIQTINRRRDYNQGLRELVNAA